MLLLLISRTGNVLKVCLAAVFACGAVLLGATACSSGTESHGDHTPTSASTTAVAPTGAVAPSSSAPEAPAPAPQVAPGPEATAVAPPAPQPQAVPAPQAPPAAQTAPQPEPAKPAPTLTAPGFEPRAGY